MGASQIEDRRLDAERAGPGDHVAQDVFASVVEPRSMSRSIDHFSGDPAVMISVVSNSIKAAPGLEA
jgi:hypothetical protein